ncbi:C-type lectin domain family 17, member A-like [Oryzias latipes]|uniref:C-type lectin domain family 17, member A-like n=1 Tax=Oryzias latipes TaxID=8090 RepID=UPI000CE183C8|nr:C-type lectin domain family 17, member A-like [Oryzias latipes]
MEDIYENFEPEDPVCQFSDSNPPASIKSNRRCYLGVITFMVMLSVLLLAGLIIVCLLYGDSVRNLSEIFDSKENLTEQLNDVIETMNSSLIETTKKLMDCKQRIHECPARWIGFGSSCYFFSLESKSWDEARKSCKANEADLVVINTVEEKTFLFEFRDKRVWIGLTDKVQEGTWIWVDGSPLTLQFWESGMPDSYRDEDCVEIRNTPGSWNDQSCEASLQWICEKKAPLYV